MTDGLEIRSARSLTHGERADLFNAAYADYLIPFHLDEHSVAAMAEAFDLDAEASRVAYRDGEAVGLGNLGLRGEDAWIGGVGVVPVARRSGIGEALMRALHDEARARGVRRIWLEVILENTGAFALYEKLGYRTIRDVEVWSLPASEEGSPGAHEVSAAEAKVSIRERGNTREPWQRADETVENYGDARGLATDGGAALFRGEGSVQILQLAGDAQPLLEALRRLGAVSVVNLPEDDAAAAAFRSSGARVVVRQHEMLLELGPTGEH
jgi:ribosomal protein S18 acetylase RimI-like enzyme